MKKQIGVWIDTSKAILVTLSGGKENITEIVSEVENRVHHENEGDKGSFTGSRHINHEKKFDERKNNQIDSFMKDVLEQIKNSDEVYIFGPAEMKMKLKQKIEHDKTLSPKLNAVETADSMTLNQVVSQVKEFFQE
jgi:hypothetical protein